MAIACLCNLFGLATCEVYLAPFVAKGPVVSYTAFSPFPSVVARCLVVCLCGTFCYLYIIYKHPSVRWHIALCCPDFPLQLLEAIAHFARQRYAKRLKSGLKQKIPITFVIGILRYKFRKISCFLTVLLIQLNHQRQQMSISRCYHLIF